MERPLIVYLDSSDYSRFADVVRGVGTKESEQVLFALLPLIEAGDVQIPFSGLHVMEAAAREETATTAAAARLKAIGQLAQGCAFRGWTELPSIDLFYFLSLDSLGDRIRPVDRSIHNGRSSNGEWFPGLPSLFKEIADMLTAGYENPVQTFIDDPNNSELLGAMNREQRRKLKKKLRQPIDPTALRNMVDSDWVMRYESMRTRFPLHAEDSEIWKKYVKSPKHNVVHAYQSFRRGFADLSLLATCMQPGEGSLNHTLTTWLRDSSTPLIELAEQLNNLRVRWKSIRNDEFKNTQRRGVLQDAKSSWEAWLIREHKDLLREVPAIRESYLLSGDQTLPNEQNPSLEFASSLPSISNRALVVRSYREIAMNPLGAERAAGKHASDIGDMFHAQYLPYCDIFRCDAFASTYLKVPAKKTGTTLISSLHELVAAINSRLTKRICV
jgi:hypothetical protein